MRDDGAIFWLQALAQPLNFLWCSTFRVSGQFLLTFQLQVDDKLDSK